MASRKILPGVSAIYAKYIHGFAQRLKKEDAIKMLRAEYDLEPEQANMIFEIFDADHNGILSIWEFQQFYSMLGDNIHDLFKQFKELEVNGSGTADFDKMWEALKTEKCMSGQTLEETDLENCIKCAAGESKSIDLVKFIHLYCRIKQFKYRD